MDTDTLLSYCLKQVFYTDMTKLKTQLTGTILLREDPDNDGTIVAIVAAPPPELTLLTEATPADNIPLLAFVAAGIDVAEASCNIAAAAGDCRLVGVSWVGRVGVIGSVVAGARVGVVGEASKSWGVAGAAWTTYNKT